MKELIDSIGKLLSGFIKEKKIGGIFSIIIVTTFLFLGVEYFAGFLYYHEINNKISVIEKIQEIRESGMQLSSNLNDELIDVEKALGERNIINVHNLFKGIRLSKVNFWKIMSSGGIWVIIGIIAAFGFLGDDKVSKGVGIFLIIAGCIISFFFNKIPDILNKTWINSILYLSGNIVIIVLLSKKGKARKK